MTDPWDFSVLFLQLLMSLYLLQNKKFLNTTRKSVSLGSSLSNSVQLCLKFYATSFCTHSILKYFLWPFSKPVPCSISEQESFGELVGRGNSVSQRFVLGSPVPRITTSILSRQHLCALSRVFPVMKKVTQSLGCSSKQPAYIWGH